MPEGYVCVRVDARGTGRSPGYLDHFSPREVRDLYEAIEWAGVQPWSTGKVGLSGVSYFAINAWLVAGLIRPHLTAMIPWEGAADWYRDMTHHGGMVSTFWRNWYDMQVLPIQHGVGRSESRQSASPASMSRARRLSTEATRAANRSDLGADILAHPLDDSYHRERSARLADRAGALPVGRELGRPRTPPPGQRRRLHRGRRNGQKWLEMHGIEHWTEFYTDYGLALQKRFFEHFLKGVDNGWLNEPPVLLQVRHVDGFVERFEYEWPLARTAWTQPPSRRRRPLAAGDPRPPRRGRSASTPAATV